MKKLLLVDDDEQILIAVEAFLNSSGFACDCVLTGSDARGCMFEGSANLYDLCFLSVIVFETHT